jgi:hypothetical protein
MNRSLSQCPVCDASLQVTELTCATCQTSLHGQFPSPPLARLPREHQSFIETFIKCRGVIRDVERALGISYPTVRAKLDAAVEALEIIMTPASATQRDDQRRYLLTQVENGTLSAAEAAQLLSEL